MVAPPLDPVKVHDRVQAPDRSKLLIRLALITHGSAGTIAMAFLGRRQRKDSIWTAPTTVYKLPLKKQTGPDKSASRDL